MEENVAKYLRMDVSSSSENVSDPVGDITNPNYRPPCVTEHYSYPIKNKEDIYKISDFLLSKGRYRDNAIFVVGINVGLRCSDLRLLKVSDFVNPDGSFKEIFYLLERKTSHTRKTKQNRHIKITKAVKEALTLLFKNSDPIKEHNDYLFLSEDNRTKNSGEPLTRRSFDRIIKKVMSDVGIEGRYATHTLRKTFGYHLYQNYGCTDAALHLLQQMFGHSSSEITLRYIGITEERVNDGYDSLNLGLRKNKV